MEWDEQQLEIINLGIERILIVAPAGTGKTEVLAARAASLIQRRLVQSPRQILALTFTNRAVANLVSRLRRVFGINYADYVTIHNFHGFAARLITAHGELIGIDPQTIIWPENGWTESQLSNLSRSDRDEALKALKSVKSLPIDDVEVISRLTQIGSQDAIDIEIIRQREGRLDHDDVLRHGERILQFENILTRYRDHYPVLFVDEIQDLTLPELRMVTLIGELPITAAGDATQSIFKFTGADPDAAFASFDPANTKIVRLRRSYRSAPAILRVVNALGELDGAEPVICADPSQFRDDGVVALLESEDTVIEAHTLMNILNSRVLVDESISVGILSRTARRSQAFENLCIETNVPYQSWSLPTHDPDVVSIIRKLRNTGKDASDEERFAAVRQACLEAVPADDLDLANSMLGAFALLYERLENGIAIEQVFDECRVSGTRDQPIGPGIHILNGHKGKGQQFDWVVVVGAEDENIPSYFANDKEALDEERRILGVMSSRAKYGLVFTIVNMEEAYGIMRNRSRSRWFEHIEPHLTEEW
jgi:DNA helicase-2/ATP-dependent DNA helicase PcrA